MKISRNGRLRLPACLALVALFIQTTAGFGQSSQNTNHQSANQHDSSKKYVEVTADNLQGRMPHAGSTFHRIDTTRFSDFPANAKLLYTHSAGLYLSFRTNSNAIYAKWCTSPSKTYNNLAAIAFEGLDLYIKRDGQWIFAGVGRPGSQDCNTSTLVAEMQEGWKECLLYLPLYDAVDQLQIGVDSAAEIEFTKSPFNRTIPVYGTSITQGASASRPGMAYPARLSRMSGLDFINLGISGSAKMEPQVAEMIAELAMDALIIDCIPNCSPDNITERTAHFIRRIRKNHPLIPIIAIEGAHFESGNFNQKIAEDMALRNERFREEIARLQQTDPHLYLLDAAGIMGDDHEGTIDGTHPNDLGFERMIQKILPYSKNILKQYNLL